VLVSGWWHTLGSEVCDDLGWLRVASKVRTSVAPFWPGKQIGLLALERLDTMRNGNRMCGMCWVCSGAVQCMSRGNSALNIPTAVPPPPPPPPPPPLHLSIVAVRHPFSRQCLTVLGQSSGYTATVVSHHPLRCREDNRRIVYCKSALWCVWYCTVCGLPFRAVCSQ